MEVFLKILFLLLAYLIGSIPFGFLICQIKDIDIRKVGSGNIGASNVRRALNKKYSALTFSCDFLKGAIFVILFRYNIIDSKYMVLDPSLYGFIAMIGHSFPIFLKFKGGKCVATGAGFIFSYLPLTLIIGLIAFVVILSITNIASISSLGATTLVTLTAIVFAIIGIDPITKIDISWVFGLFSFLALLLIFYRHIPNIKRLINKEELKANQNKQKRETN